MAKIRNAVINLLWHIQPIIVVLSSAICIVVEGQESFNYHHVNNVFRGKSFNNTSAFSHCENQTPHYSRISLKDCAYYINLSLAFISPLEH